MAINLRRCHQYLGGPSILYHRRDLQLKSTRGTSGRRAEEPSLSLMTRPRMLVLRARRVHVGRLTSSTSDVGLGVNIYYLSTSRNVQYFFCTTPSRMQCQVPNICRASEGTSALQGTPETPLSQAPIAHEINLASAKTLTQACRPQGRSSQGVVKKKKAI